MLSTLERTKRIDADFYSKKNQNDLKILLSKNSRPITELLTVSDGNHMSVSDFYSDVGIPYYRGGDIYHFFIEQATKSLKIDPHAFNHKNMKRSHLKKGDILLSIVGAIIGNVSIVNTNDKATCSCKLAILRPTNVMPLFFATFLKSKYGQNQIQKFRRGGGQTGLILEDFNQLLSPSFSDEFQSVVSSLVSKAYDKIQSSLNIYVQADDLLLKTIGLTNFTQNREPINIKSFIDSFGASGRLDAEYYQPKYEQMLELIKAQAHATLGNLVDIQKSIEPGSDAYTEDEDGVPFMRVADYSKLGMIKPQVRLSGTFVAENFEKIEKLKPKKDSILFSKDGSVGEAYRLSKDANFITSGAILHLTVKDQTKVLPDYLTLALNSIVVKQQAERDAGGSIILHWRKEEIENAVVPIINMPIQRKIAAQVQESFKLKTESEHLLDIAKQAVEMAIEKNETVGIRFIEQNLT